MLDASDHGVGVQGEGFGEEAQAFLPARAVGDAAHHLPDLVDDFGVEHGQCQPRIGVAVAQRDRAVESRPHLAREAERQRFRHADALAVPPQGIRMPEPGIRIVGLRIRLGPRTLRRLAEQLEPAAFAGLQVDRVNDRSLVRGGNARSAGRQPDPRGFLEPSAVEQRPGLERRGLPGYGLRIALVQPLPSAQHVAGREGVLAAIGEGGPGWHGVSCVRPEERRPHHAASAGAWLSSKAWRCRRWPSVR